MVLSRFFSQLRCIFLAISIFSTSLFGNSHAADTDSIDSIIDFQTGIINNSYETAYIFGDDAIKQLEGISLNALISYIKSRTEGLGTPVIFYTDIDLGFHYYCSPDFPYDVQEQATDSPYARQQKYRNYPIYTDFNIPKILEDSKLLIGISSCLRDGVICLKLNAMIPEYINSDNYKFKKISCWYSYNLKIQQHNSDEKTEDITTEDYLISLYSGNKEFFVDEDGFLSDITIREFSWQLSDISISIANEDYNKSDLENISIYDFFENWK